MDASLAHGNHRFDEFGNQPGIVVGRRPEDPGAGTTKGVPLGRVFKRRPFHRVGCAGEQDDHRLKLDDRAAPSEDQDAPVEVEDINGASAPIMERNQQTSSKRYLATRAPARVSPFLAARRAAVEQPGDGFKRKRGAPEVHVASLNLRATIGSTGAEVEFPNCYSVAP